MHAVSKVRTGLRGRQRQIAQRLGFGGELTTGAAGGCYQSAAPPGDGNCPLARGRSGLPPATVGSGARRCTAARTTHIQGEGLWEEAQQRRCHRCCAGRDRQAEHALAVWEEPLRYFQGSLIPRSAYWAGWQRKLHQQERCSGSLGTWRGSSLDYSPARKSRRQASVSNGGH